MLREEGNSISVRDEQPLNALLIIELTELGITTDLKPVQAAKVSSLTVVIDSGIIKESRLVQLRKAPAPIEVTDSGRTSFSRDEQFWKA